MSTDDEHCHCGEPLHYSDPNMRHAIEQVIELTGRYEPVTTADGTFLVDRHYIALHGYKRADLPDLGFIRQPDQAPAD